MSEHSTAGRADQGEHDDDMLDDVDDDMLDDVDDDMLDDVDDEQAERAQEVMRELADTRRKIAEVPAVQVITNHAMGLFELAAIHLSAGKEHLAESALAIDAMGALVEGLTGRLGEQEHVLKDALAQIRMAFVQMKQTHLTAADEA